MRPMIATVSGMLAKACVGFLAPAVLTSSSALYRSFLDVKVSPRSTWRATRPVLVVVRRARPEGPKAHLAISFAMADVNLSG